MSNEIDFDGLREWARELGAADRLDLLRQARDEGMDLSDRDRRIKFSAAVLEAQAELDGEPTPRAWDRLVAEDMT